MIIRQDGEKRKRLQRIQVFGHLGMGLSPDDWAGNAQEPPESGDGAFGE